MSYCRIEEIKLRDFPWDEMPWARRSPGINELKIFTAPPLDHETPVLVLLKNGRRVAYLVYNVWNDVDYVEIHYVETDFPYQKKGYATELINWIFEKFSSKYEIHATKTGGISESTLRGRGFENTAPLTWIRKKEKKGA